MNESNENETMLATNENFNLQSSINNKLKDTYSSLKNNTIESKKIMFNALQKCDYRVSDMLDTEIDLVNVIMQHYQKVNDETGEVEDKIKTILIDKDKKTYASASHGLFNSMLNVLSMFGEPSKWEEPLKIKVVETKTKQGFKTFEIKIM